jgi:hypothetical protein
LEVFYLNFFSLKTEAVGDDGDTAHNHGEDGQLSPIRRSLRSDDLVTCRYSDGNHVIPVTGMLTFVSVMSLLHASVRWSLGAYTKHWAALWG